MSLRLLARAAPIVLGALAAAIVLRRRRPQRPALPAPAVPPAPMPFPVAPLVSADTQDVPEEAPGPPTARFTRDSEGPPIDIVTVVDDLLGV